MFTRATPSIIVASIDGVSSDTTDSGSKHLKIRSDLFLKRILLFWLKDGGKRLFLCLKKSSTFPLRVWQDMYSLETKVQSFLRTDRLDFSFEVVFTEGVRNKDITCFFMGSNISFSRLTNLSSTNCSYMSCPECSICRTVCTTHGSVMSFVCFVEKKSDRLETWFRLECC